MVREFLDKMGFDSIHQENETGDNPLCIAVYWNSIEIVRELIRMGADINHRCEFGVTPLQSAIEQNNLEIAKLLLNAGANPNIQDEKGYTARDMAEVSESSNIRSIFTDSP